MTCVIFNISKCYCNELKVLHNKIVLSRMAWISDRMLWPLLVTVPLQWVAEGFFTQAMANYVTISIAQNERLVTEAIIFMFDCRETINCSLIQEPFGNIL